MNDIFKKINVAYNLQTKIKPWKPGFPCRLCRLYIADIGFIEL